MTDNAMADKIYIEPLTLETVKRIIKKERPDSLLSTLGGQTGLTLSMQLAKEGFLDKYNVQLLGANPETIDKAEDRQLFKDTMIEIGQPVIPSLVVTDSHRHRSYLRMPVQPLSPAVFPRLSGKFRIPLRAAASEALFRSYQETAP